MGVGELKVGGGEIRNQGLVFSYKTSYCVLMEVLCTC